MLTAFIAVDRCDTENGCLKVYISMSLCDLLNNHTLFPRTQVLRGSHKAGRINHIRVGDQVGADLERVEQLGKVN